MRLPGAGWQGRPTLWRTRSRVPRRYSCRRLQLCPRHWIRSLSFSTARTQSRAASGVQSLVSPIRTGAGKSPGAARKVRAPRGAARLALAVAVSHLAAAAASPAVDLVVYAATPAGIASAVVAARQGQRTLLVEPEKMIGGLLTGGLSYTDFRSQEAVTGFFREYMDRVLRHYRDQYGAGSQQEHDCYFGAHAEPHVSLAILHRMIAATKGLQVRTQRRVVAAEKSGSRIAAIRVAGPNGEERFAARAFIDASYEGDLAAAAKVPYRIGRESTREYGERLAGVLFFEQGKILPGSTGEADRHAQCYNFRLIMTDRPANRVPVEKPPGYRRDEYARILPHFHSGRIKEIFTEPATGILRVQWIPNRKADINDIKNAPIRLALAGENYGWPEGTPEVRRTIYDRHKQYTLGLLWFLQNDAAIPEAIRAKASQWGWARDEYADNGYFPPALYIREARRVIGEYIFTERDTQPAPDSVRAPLHGAAVAIGDYSLNSHGHQAPGPLYPDLVEGDYGYPTAPFQIPYGVIVPKGVDNLLVPVAVSASHVGFSALRLEPTWTAMGHAAGLAADLALRSGKPMREVDVAAMQRTLHRQGQATTYTPDVPPASPLFAAAQWAGLRGYLDDLVDYRTARLSPAKHRHGLQYTVAFPNHLVEPGQPLDERLRARWRARLGRDLPNARTRGDFLQAAYQLEK
jgi:hypothetical protein